MDNWIIAVVILSAILGAGIGFGLSYAVFLNRISEPYIHSQLLGIPPTNINASSSVGGWILNWTPTTEGFC